MKPKCPFCQRVYGSYYGLHKHQKFCAQRASTANTTDLPSNANRPSSLNENAPVMPKAISEKAKKKSVNIFVVERKKKTKLKC